MERSDPKSEWHSDYKDIPIKERTVRTKEINRKKERRKKVKMRKLTEKNQRMRVYEIERIIDHKKHGKDKYSYLVRWKGYDSSNDSWVKQEDFNSTKIIKEYWKSEQ